MLIVPVSLVVALVSHDRRSGYGGWLLVAFVAILYGYATAGYGAARARPDAPLAHGMLAGLGAFLVWLLVRLAVPLARGDRLGFGIVAVVTNRCSPSLSARLPAASSRAAAVAPTALPRLTASSLSTTRARPNTAYCDTGGGGESAGRPRTGPFAVTGPRNVRTPQGRVLGNTQSGRPAGKCHREQTADGAARAQVRVKRCGKSAPAPGVTRAAR